MGDEHKDIFMKLVTEKIRFDLMAAIKHKDPDYVYFHVPSWCWCKLEILDIYTLIWSNIGRHIRNFYDEV